MHDDTGKPLHGASAGGQGGRIWDFRNASARQYLADHVAGYFARAEGVMGVFFDEGESFACHYNCRALNTCKTMPNAKEWHAGALQAWKLAAETMAAAGKIAVISSQNSFKASTPYLMKTPHGCPLTEDEALAVMNSSELAMKGWHRFYEYFAHPGPNSKNAELYCSNSIRNMATETQTHNIPIVASASDYPAVVPHPGPSPNPPPGPPPHPGPNGFEISIQDCTLDATRMAYDGSSGRITFIGDPSNAATVGVSGCNVAAGAGVVAGAAKVCPAEASEWSHSADTGYISSKANGSLCLTVPPHKSGHLEECHPGTEGSRFVVRPANSTTGTHAGLVLAKGQFRAGECLGVIAPTSLLPGQVVPFEFALGMFMVSQGGADAKQSYFEYNHDKWTKWPRWADGDTSWNEAKPFYQRDYGVPTARTEEPTKGLFLRKYTKVTITVDCRNASVNYAWV